MKTIYGNNKTTKQLKDLINKTDPTENLLITKLDERAYRDLGYSNEYIAENFISAIKIKTHKLIYIKSCKVAYRLVTQKSSLSCAIISAGASDRYRLNK